MRLLSLTLFLAGAALPACSSDGASSSASEAGAVDSGASDGTVTTATATQGCTTYVDRTLGIADRTIVWSYDVAQDPGHCMQIKAGQAVTFVDTNGTTVADFVTHPMLAQGGDRPSPIESFDRTTGRAPFPNAGTFGFQCAHHETMLGAILVVP